MGINGMGSSDRSLFISFNFKQLDWLLIKEINCYLGLKFAKDSAFQLLTMAKSYKHRNI